MPDSPGWTANPVALLHYRVLLAMYGGKTKASEIGQLLHVEHEDVAERFAMMQVVGEVVTAPLRLGSRFPDRATITPHGRALVESWSEARTPRRVRRACESALLCWLDAHEGERILSTDAFVGDVRAYFFGDPFAPTVVVDAARELQGHKLIKGGPRLVVLCCPPPSPRSDAR